MLPQNRLETPSITLALDPDDAGKKATDDAVTLIMDIAGSWGTVRNPGEPASMARAEAEKAWLQASERLQALEAIAESTPSLDFSDDIRLYENLCRFTWEHAMKWREEDRPGNYSAAKTADEFIAAENLRTMVKMSDGPRVDYAAIKERVDIVGYIGKRTPLRRSGARWTGKCPLPDHKDDTASLTVYPHNKSWYCFGCRRGGDVINFAQMMGLNVEGS